MQQDYILLKEAENAWLIEEAWDVMPYHGVLGHRYESAFYSFDLRCS
jgi:hypothetical protein